MAVDANVAACVTRQNVSDTRAKHAFKVVSEYSPAGDQPRAIAELAAGIERGDRFQTLLGITGSGKSATIAWTIERVQRPTLILAPNKSLAAQLAQEMREFFPENRVEYFVSYYDYYQPEAYIPSSDTYIEKDSSINDEIDRLRHSATAALLTRRDVIVVASVSCIYGMGNPEEYKGHLLELHQGVDYDQQSILRRLVDLQYERNDTALGRGNFRVRGDTIERIEILRALRLGEFDVLVGINLLREGLDLPEVSLRKKPSLSASRIATSETSLIQTIGRAARNVDGQVIMYADQRTKAMEAAIGLTNARRERQMAYNLEHGIEPKTIRKAVGDILSILRPDETAPYPGKGKRQSRERDKVIRDLKALGASELERLVQTLEEEMHQAAADLHFEQAARLRDEIRQLRREVREAR
ncbi:MAG: hypothetical protein EBX51_00230 [Acidimicrobiia bacterium]|nr:hypothetical protein [Acidimicrobiia bacterium]